MISTRGVAFSRSTSMAPRKLAPMELDAARCRVAQSVAQDILGFGIGDEGDDIFAIRAGRRLLGRDVGDGYVGRHH